MNATETLARSTPMAIDPLVHFLERRDRAAFAALVKGTRSVVFRAAWRVLGDRDLAEDVTQDVFLRCLNPPWAPGDVRDGRALLAGTAVNLARMKVRGEVRMRRREQVAAERRTVDERSVADPETLAHVRHAVDALPEGLRHVVELRYFGGLRIEDLARSLDVSLTTAKARLREARDLLRPRLADTAFSGVLGYLVGDRETPGFLDELPSPRLDTALQRLADEGITLSRIAARRPSQPKWLVAGALIVAVGSALWAVAAGDLDGPPANGAGAEPELVDTADTGGASEDSSRRRGRDRVGRGDGGPGAPTDVDPSAGDDGAGAVVAAEEAEGSIDLELLVVDARGEPIRRGHVELDLAGLPSFDVIEQLAQYRELLKPFSLADANPVVIEGLADFTDGLELEAAATVPGLPPSAASAAFLRKGERARITVRVVAASEMTVNVVDDDSGEAISDAVVLCITELERRGFDPDEPPQAPASGVGRADASGRVVVGGLGAGPHHLEVRAPGYRAADLEDVSLGKDLTVRLRALAGVSTVVVNVRGPQGEPAVGQRVELNLSGQDTSRIERVGADGVCRFEDVPPGHHMLTLDVMDWAERVIAAKADIGDAAITEMFEARPGETFQFRLGYLPMAAPLVVEVADAAGRPAVGVKVQVYGALLKDGETGEDGRVTFDALPEGVYSVHVDSGTDWTAARDVEIAAGAPGHVSAVIGTGTISGRVVTADGEKGLRQCGVFVEGPLTALEWTDSDGRFTLRGLPPGEVLLTFSAGADLLSQQRTVRIVDGAATESLDIRMLQGGRIRVLRAADDPCDVRATDAAGEARESTETDDGHFELRALPEGRCIVEILRGGAVVATHQVEVLAGEVAEIDLR